MGAYYLMLLHSRAFLGITSRNTFQIARKPRVDPPLWSSVWFWRYKETPLCKYCIVLVLCYDCILFVFIALRAVPSRTAETFVCLFVFSFPNCFHCCHWQPYHCLTLCSLYRFDGAGTSLSQTKDVLSSIASHCMIEEGECLNAVEIFWSPSEPNEVLTKREMIMDFPELIDL
jgi:hypothetical protein